MSNQSEQIKAEKNSLTTKVLEMFDAYMSGARTAMSDHDPTIAKDEFAQCERCNMWQRLNKDDVRTGLLNFNNFWVCERCFYYLEDTSDEEELEESEEMSTTLNKKGIVLMK